MIYYRQENPKLEREPKVSIIIPTKGNVPILLNCINSIIEKTKYSNYSIWLADTGNTPEETEQIRTALEKIPNKITVIKFEFWNFGTINNLMARQFIDSDTELLCFCNNDIKFINDVITNAVDSYLREPNCGTIGCRLYFADDTLQHAGILLVVKPSLGLTHYGLRTPNLYDKTERKPTFGNTCALNFIPKKLFDEINGFSTNYIECFEDVELNVECIIRDKVNIFNPNCVAYHLESQSRKQSDEKLKRENQDLTQRSLPFIVKNFDIIKNKLKMEKYGEVIFIR